RPESERTERGRRQRGSETISSWGDSILLVGTISYAYSLPSLKVLYIQLVEGANAVRGENPCLFPVRSVRASLGRCTVLMQVKCSRGGEGLCSIRTSTNIREWLCTTYWFHSMGRRRPSGQCSIWSTFPRSIRTFRCIC